ncbi:hypothetical protein [Microbacterium sp. NPDC089695]|uniref:hypothetical protein n=1 Tax=Microbacterium sp. NPDC089695 TaxID=3364198 RepID=UPI003805909B
MSDDRRYDERPPARPSDPESALPQKPTEPSKQPGCFLLVLVFIAIVVLGALAAMGIPNLVRGEPFFGSQQPDVRQQVREAADKYFGESNMNSIYVTGTSRLCNDLEAGMAAEQSLVDADPVTAAFYTEIAVPIMCPELR